MACGDLSEEAPKTSVAATQADGLAVVTGKADGDGPYQGDLAWGEAAEAELVEAAPYHLYRLSAKADQRARVTLEGVDELDAFAVIYSQGEGGWQYLDHNDDCADGEVAGRYDACLEVDLAAGDYLVLASTWQYMDHREQAVGAYSLQARCIGDRCEDDTKPALCGSRGLDACPEGQYCQYPDSACGADDRPGVCAPRPELCTEQYDPVCGCDGQTYSNSCFAAHAGVSVSHEGACPPPGQGPGELCGGIAGLRCAEGLTCSYAAVRSCDIADAAGICVSEEPRICPQVYAPVCGCDGRTYPNDCIRRAAGVAFDHEGRCVR